MDMAFRGWIVLGRLESLYRLCAGKLIFVSL